MDKLSNVNAILCDAALLKDNDFNSYSNMDKFLFLVDNEGIIKNILPKTATQYYIGEDMFI